MKNDTEEKFRLPTDNKKFIKRVADESKGTPHEINKSEIMRLGSLEKAKKILKQIEKDK